MSYHVLIIDKDQTFCQTVAQALEPLGLEITLVHDGDEGLALAEKQSPDLIMLSAELQGYSLCRKMRKGKPGEAKIIITSDKADKVFETHRNREGAADAYLIKPISESQVITQINQLLQLGLNPQLFGGASLDAFIEAMGPQDQGSAAVSDGDSLRQELDAKEQHLTYLKKEMEAYREGYRMLEVALKDKTDRYESSEARVKDLESRIADLETLDDQVSERKAKIKQLEQSLNRKDTNLAEAEAENQRLEGEVSRIGHELDQQKSKLKGFQGDQNRQQTELEELNQTLHEQKTRLDERNRQIKQLEADLRELQAQRSQEDSNLEEVRKHNEQLKRQSRERDQLIEDQATQLRHMQEQQEALRQRLHDRESQLAEQERQRQRERDELEASQQEALALRGEITTMQDHLDDGLRDREGLETELSNLRISMETLSSKLQESEKEGLGLQRQLDGMHEKAEQAQAALDEANRRLENQESTIVSLEAELKKTHDLDSSFSRFKETAQKNSEETTREHKRALEKLRSEMATQKASFDDMRQSIDRENEGIVRGLKEDLLRTRKEAELMVQRNNQEKADQLEQLRIGLKQMKIQYEQAEGESHARKEEVAGLTKKMRQQEESHQHATQKLRSIFEAEQQRAQEQAEEDVKSVRLDCDKQLEERAVQITAIERSNKEYANKITQLESKISQLDKEHENERVSLMDRIGSLEHTIESLNQALSREKEDHQTATGKFLDREREFKQREEALNKVAVDAGRRHQVELSGEKTRLKVVQEQVDHLEVQLSDMQSVQRENEHLQRDLDKMRLGHELLKARLAATKSALQAGLLELQGTSESLELELED